ncbi:unnamed protein product [Coregonus sp. 'balchen']|nr:unnamed protein product [Coregonus sp. 'balchen']
MKRIKTCTLKKDRIIFQRREIQTLQQVDELFLFLTHLALGLKDRDLGQHFHIHPSTVSRIIIITWANFLYTLEVKANLPEEFKSYPDTQVIVDSTSLLLQSEMFSNYKSHRTMKALNQILTAEVHQTEEIACLRIHVERVIRRVKENKLFDANIPLAIAGSINQLFTVACLLSNYQCRALVKKWAKEV